MEKESFEDFPYGEHVPESHDEQKSSSEKPKSYEESMDDLMESASRHHIHPDTLRKAEILSEGEQLDLSTVKEGSTIIMKVGKDSYKFKVTNKVDDLHHIMGEITGGIFGSEIISDVYINGSSIQGSLLKVNSIVKDCNINFAVPVRDLSKIRGFKIDEEQEKDYKAMEKVVSRVGEIAREFIIPTHIIEDFEIIPPEEKITPENITGEQ